MSEGGRPTGWEAVNSRFAPGAGERPAPPEPPPPPLTCAVCGAELEPDQTYCLECGSPTPLAPRLRRAGRTAAILAGAVAILGLGAGALAFAVVNDDGTGTSVTTALTTTTAVAPVVPGTAPVATVPPVTTATIGTLPADPSATAPTTPVVTAPGTGTGTATGFDTVTGPSSAPAATTAPATTTAKPATTTAAPATTTVAPSAGASDWPSGRTAWTAVLASVRNESDARSAKGRVAKAGDPAGVLFSTRFPALRPGYWVVFSGMYASRNTAIAQATKLTPGFPTAYARRIEG